MINRNNDIKKIDFQSNKLYKRNDILFTESLVKIINNKDFNKELIEQEDYQDNITSYINRKYENSIKKEYNPKIVSLYNNGMMAINNNEYSLKDFFIVFSDKLDFHIKCINKNYPNEEIEYNHSTKFIDTTAFINLINISNIVDNKIIVNDINILNDIVSIWDGYLHSETVETDSIINKRIVEVNNE